MTLLNLVLALPLAGFLIVLLMPREKPQVIRGVALVIALLTFVLSIGLATGLCSDVPGAQFSTDVIWIPSPEIHYHVGIDGLSLWLVLLSTLLTPICVLISWRFIEKRVKEFYAFLLLLSFGLVGVFVSLDLFLFYAFWELSLVPMYFLIGIWGHERRVYAAVKFFLYTMAGSVLMLAAIIYLYNRASTFNYTAILEMLASGKLSLTNGEEMLLFLAFFI